jgi:hypothetical protein
MFKKILLYLTDWELFSKPKSTEIRESVINDILRVDPKKWFHPKLPNGETCKYWGTIEKDADGKDICKEGTVDLFTNQHPDLDYLIKDYPMKTYKDGELHNLTEKDCRLIREAFYREVTYVSL